MKRIFVLFFIFTSILSYAAEMYKSKEEFLKGVEQRAKAIKKEDEENQRLSNSIELIGGDRAQLFKLCRKPRAWIPNDDITVATEWHYVPYGVKSKTYPLERGQGGARIQEIIVKDKDGKEVPKSECDFISVKFENNKIKTIDLSLCPKMGYGTYKADSQKACENFLEKF